MSLSRRQQARPVTCRPMLDLLLDGDRAVQGFILHVFEASTARRHAIFLALGPIAEAEDREAAIEARGFPDLATLAQALVKRPTKILLTDLLGSLPDGLLGLFARLPQDPLPVDIYAQLHRVFEEDSRRAETLRQLPGEVTLAKIEAVLSLESVALHPDVVRYVFARHVAFEVNAIVRAARRLSSRATDECLALSIKCSRAHTRKLAEFWLKRIDRLPVAPPFVENDPEFRVLNGPEMLEAARGYKNCLQTKLASVGAGLAVYAEVRSKQVIVELRPLTGGDWLATEIAGPNNAPISKGVLDEIKCLLAERGILALAPSPYEDGRVISRYAHFGFDDLLLPDGDEELAA